MVRHTAVYVCPKLETTKSQSSGVPVVVLMDTPMLFCQQLNSLMALGKVSASTARDLWIVPWWSHTSYLKLGVLVAHLLEALCFGVNIRTGWPVSVLLEAWCFGVSVRTGWPVSILLEAWCFGVSVRTGWPSVCILLEAWCFGVSVRTGWPSVCILLEAWCFGVSVRTGWPSVCILLEAWCFGVSVRTGWPSVCILLEAWCFGVSVRTGWPTVCILWLAWVASWISNCCLFVTWLWQPVKFVWADSTLRYTLACLWDVKQPTNKHCLWQ